MTQSVWQGAADPGSKLMSAERALAAIKPGSRVYLGTGCAAPQRLHRQARGDGPGSGRPRVRQLPHDIMRCPRELACRQHATATGRSSSAATCVVSRVSDRLDYVPICLEEVPELLATGRLPIDVALLQVSSPDARGFVSLGVSVDLAPAVLAVARHVIAEVNPAMPRTHGESLVHLDRFDALVSVDTPVTEYRHPPTGETAEMVARYIAAIIDDGSTLQIGLGRVPNEALRYLRDRRDLGIHSDVITDGVVDLVEAGVVTGSPQDAPPRPDRHQLLPRDAAALRFRARQSSVCIPADRPGLRSGGDRRQPADGLDHPGLRRRSHGPGLRRSVRRRVLRRRLDPGGFHPGRGALGRRQADHLPRLDDRCRGFADQASPGGRRWRGDRAIGRALRRHRVRHRLSVREIDPRAGGSADRDRAPELSRGAARGGQAAGLRPRRAVSGLPGRLSGARGAPDAAQERRRGPDPAGARRRRGGLAGVVPPPVAGRRLHPLLPARALAFAAASCKRFAT